MSLDTIYQAILQYDEARVSELVGAELAAGTEVSAILNEALIAAMDEVGKQFSAGDIFVPEMLMAAQAMKGGLAVLKPHLTGESSHSRGTVVIGTVKGDLHDIGKNLVAMMLEGGGLTVVDIGVDASAEKFIEAAKGHQAQVIALSALLTTTMPAMASTIKAVREAGVSAKTIIGGAPVTQAFADQIGADGYGADASAAVQLARRMIAQN